jgi:hypothetical protein
MKRLAIIAVFLLSGCSVVQAYFMAKYDVAEHSMINDIRTTAELADCSNHESMKSTSTRLYSVGSALRNYSASIPDNEPVVLIADNLLIIIKGVNNKYQTSAEVSETYCKLKVDSIKNAAAEAQRVIARKPR